VISEKLDGTNASVFVWNESATDPASIDPKHSGASRAFGCPQTRGFLDVPWLWEQEGIHIAAGSRKRWLTISSDNYGFAKWVQESAASLIQLRHGRHFGEWWGNGINRGYDRPPGNRRFSLFNTIRWCPAGATPELISTNHKGEEKWQEEAPPCCGIVPVLYRGIFSTWAVETALANLKEIGSFAVPGYRNPEGIVIFHTAQGNLFKVTLENDAKPKGGGEEA